MVRGSFADSQVSTGKAQTAALESWKNRVISQRKDAGLKAWHTAAWLPRLYYGRAVELDPQRCKLKTALACVRKPKLREQAWLCALAVLIRSRRWWV